MSKVKSKKYLSKKYLSKKYLKSLHRYLGFPLGILFVVTFGSGCLTALDELLTRAAQANGKISYSWPSSLFEFTFNAEEKNGFNETASLEKTAQALSVVTAGKPAVRQVLLPTFQAPYYRVKARGERWTYRISDFQLVSHVQQESSFFETVLKLHRNFLLGKTGLWSVKGQHVVAWLGLIAALISVLGLWLWWPMRKSFALNQLVPRTRERKSFYFSHVSSGVLVLAAIVFLAFTGASMAYSVFTQQILGVERDDRKNRFSDTDDQFGKKQSEKMQSEKKQVEISHLENKPTEQTWYAWLQLAHEHMPAGAQLRSIRFPPQIERTHRDRSSLRPSNTQSNTQDVLEWRFLTADDWFGLASSSVRFVGLSADRSAMQVETAPFSTLSWGAKIYTLLKPLHTGRDLPVVYVWILFIFSLLGTLTVFSALVSFVIKVGIAVKKRQEHLIRAIWISLNY